MKKFQSVPEILAKVQLQMLQCTKNFEQQKEPALFVAQSFLYIAAFAIEL